MTAKYLILIFLSLEISLNMMTSYRSAICSSNLIPKDTWTTMFIAELFTIAKLWKQPRCPTTGKCIKKMWSATPPTTGFGEDAGKKEPSYTAGGNVD
jgi:hypothetical protein